MCDFKQKSSYEHGSDIERLPRYGKKKIRTIRSKSDPCSYELFCLESHILSFRKVLQIPPETPCIIGEIFFTGDFERMVRIFRSRSKSDPFSYERFCLESHILSFPKVLQIPPESPCIMGEIFYWGF